MDITSDAAMTMNPSDLLAMFNVNDGSGIDVASLLMSPSMDGQNLGDSTPTSPFFGIGSSGNGIISSP